jgi:MGT family glycosyltransferase
MVDVIVTGLGEVDCTAVVAVGSGKLPAIAGPPTVRLVESVPQPLVLECSDVFINHGGFNSVREALRLGVPMVIVPWLTDSHRNAERCAELGAATVVPFDMLTAARLRDACAEVLGDPGYRQRARAMQREMLALPGMEVLVRDLCALVDATVQRRG